MKGLPSLEEQKDDAGDLPADASDADRTLDGSADLLLELRRHGPSLAMAAGGLIAIIGVRLAFRAWERRRNRSLLLKLRRLGDALSRVVAHPERVAAVQPSASRKVLASAASSIVGAMATKITQRILAEPDRSRVARAAEA